jgi:cadmium resistance protein CadD (predicted permease)
MQFGQAIGTACVTFAVTNIDDAFVLVTFFAESARNKNLTPLKITTGQFIGFTIVIIISMIGFGVSLVLPSEPIGFLGLLPILLGVWKSLDIIIPIPNGSPDALKSDGIQSVFKVAAITVMNGGDNIGTYIPLFSQVKGAEIATYNVVYYILLGLWCLIGFLVMKEKHVLHIAEKYVGFLIPFLYTGLGVYIVVKSEAYSWSIEHINISKPQPFGKVILAAMTALIMLLSIGIMVWVKLMRKRKAIAIEETQQQAHALEDTSLGTASERR